MKRIADVLLGLTEAIIDWTQQLQLFFFSFSQVTAIPLQNHGTD
jgi:hypothetical protein